MLSKWAARPPFWLLAAAFAKLQGAGPHLAAGCSLTIPATHCCFHWQSRPARARARCTGVRPARPSYTYSLPPHLPEVLLHTPQRRVGQQVAEVQQLAHLDERGPCRLLVQEGAGQQGSDGCSQPRHASIRKGLRAAPQVTAPRRPTHALTTTTATTTRSHPPTRTPGSLLAFSDSTCLPAARHCFTVSIIACGGMTANTASTSGSASSSTRPPSPKKGCTPGATLRAGQGQPGGRQAGLIRRAGGSKMLGWSFEIKPFEQLPPRRCGTAAEATCGVAGGGTASRVGRKHLRAHSTRPCGARCFNLLAAC